MWVFASNELAGNCMKSSGPWTAIANNTAQPKKGMRFELGAAMLEVKRKGMPPWLTGENLIPKELLWFSAACLKTRSAYKK